MHALEESIYTVKSALVGLAGLMMVGASAGFDAITSEVKAEVLLFAANSANYIQNITASDYADFNGPAAGGKSYTFRTIQANERVLITFEATCYKSFPGTVTVNILVDPAGTTGEFAASPTNSTFEGGVVLCRYESDDPGLHAVHTSITATARPSQAGTHSVRVRVFPGSQGQVAIGTALITVTH